MKKMKNNVKNMLGQLLSRILRQGLGVLAFALMLAFSAMVVKIPQMGIVANAESADFSQYIPTGDDSDTVLNNKQVIFNSKNWYIINANSQEVTLFLAGHYDAETTFNNLNTYLTNLTNSDYSAVKGLMNGSLYSLSLSEAQNLPGNIRKCTCGLQSGGWWTSTDARWVYCLDGDIIQNSAIADDEMRVRPALKLNLNKVQFYTTTRAFSIAVTGVTVNPTSGTLKENQTLQLSATVEPANVDNKNVTWSSDNTTVATVSSSGLVTANGVGEANITVTTELGNKTASCKITVVKPVTGISLISTSKELNINGIYTISPVISPSDATNKNVVYRSDNPSIARVDANGVVTGVSAGNTTIHVTTVDGGFSAELEIKVNSVVVNPDPSGNGSSEAGAVSETTENTQQETTETVDEKQKNTTLSKPKAGKKSFSLTWKKATAKGIKGYEIQYSTDKNFKNDVKTVTISKAKTTSKTIKKLKSKKKYYIRIRTYKKSGGEKIYSKWSKSKSVKVK